MKSKLTYCRDKGAKMKNNKLLIIACITLVASIIFAYCIVTISIHNAAAEEVQQKKIEDTE